MTRFERKNRTDIKYHLRGPVFDAVDNFIKGYWRINDEEYDYLCDELNDVELMLFSLLGELSISELKLIINRTNELLEIKANMVSINRDNRIDEIINTTE